jgi:hypothetical protein
MKRISEKTERFLVITFFQIKRIGLALGLTPEQALIISAPALGCGIYPEFPPSTV